LILWSFSPWTIWNERNQRTFDSRVKTVLELWSCIQDEAVAWDFADFKKVIAFVAASGRGSGRQLLAL
jgi:hypothetical protein